MAAISSTSRYNVPERSRRRRRSLLRLPEVPFLVAEFEKIFFVQSKNISRGRVREDISPNIGTVPSLPGLT